MNNPSETEFIRRVTQRELNLLEELDVENGLSSLLQNGHLQAFAKAFYFIRVHFVRLNFIVGARCPTHEVHWGGLAHNLMEELGGEIGPAHNELYRWFLQEVGMQNENSLECPTFARHFDEQWENFARCAPLDEALGAIAVYEIFDNPDYEMLLNVMTQAGVSERGLLFFRVHAGAAHFELFEDYFRHASRQRGGLETLERATDFVLARQKEMWSGLLDHVERDVGNGRVTPTV